MRGGPIPLLHRPLVPLHMVATGLGIFKDEQILQLA